MEKKTIPVRREVTEKLYQKIREEHKRLRGIKHGSAQKYSEDCILLMVGEKFYRSPKTIENIVYHRV